MTVELEIQDKLRANLTWLQHNTCASRPDAARNLEEIRKETLELANQLAAKLEPAAENKK